MFSARSPIVVVAALAIAASESDAQSPTRRPQSSPDSARLAADLFFRAVADERWTTAAAMMDTTLMRFIVAQRLRWQPQGTRPELTLEEEFADVKSPLELARLSTLEATERYLRAQDLRQQVRIAARRAGCSDSIDRPPVTLRHIVGVAMASDTVAYVLHEESSPPDEGDGLPRLEPMILQLRLRGAHWTIVPGSALLRSPMAAGVAVRCDSLRRPSP